MTESYYADRVTMMYAAGDDADALMVHEVTIEPVARKFESVDFQTIAWCPDDESAQFILDALLMAAANKAMLKALVALEEAVFGTDRSAQREAGYDARAAIKQATGD